MPFDPTKPANGAPIVSAELRSQLTGLNDAIDNAVATSANNVDALNPLALTVSNPPPTAQVQSIVDKLNALINGLKRP